MSNHEGHLRPLEDCPHVTLMDGTIEIIPIMGMP